jgi:hypothetical protein
MSCTTSVKKPCKIAANLANDQLFYFSVAQTGSVPKKKYTRFFRGSQQFDHWLIVKFRKKKVKNAIFQTTDVVLGKSLIQLNISCGIRPFL